LWMTQQSPNLMENSDHFLCLKIKGFYYLWYILLPPCYWTCFACRHSSMQHVPLSRYRENLKEIVQNIRERGVTQIVMITPPPVYEPGRKEWQVQVRNL
jgi:hypothetical protein